MCTRTLETKLTSYSEPRLKGNQGERTLPASPQPHRPHGKLMSPEAPRRMRPNNAHVRKRLHEKKKRKQLSDVPSKRRPPVERTKRSNSAHVRKPTIVRRGAPHRRPQ